MMKKVNLDVEAELPKFSTCKIADAHSSNFAGKIKFQARSRGSRIAMMRFLGSFLEAAERSLTGQRRKRRESVYESESRTEPFRRGPSVTAANTETGAASSPHIVTSSSRSLHHHQGSRTDLDSRTDKRNHPAHDSLTSDHLYYLGVD